MATSNTARGWFTIVDLNDGRTLNFGISANGATTQIFNPDSGVYNADFTTTPLTLAPFLYITGESNNMIAQVSNISWTVNGSNATDWGTVGNSSPYALTITRNLNGNTTSLQCVVTGRFTDPETGLTTTVTSEKTITRLDTAGSTLFCLLTYPGSTYFYNDSVASIQITATMFCGTTADTTNVEYTWYKYSTGGWTKITSSNHGTITGWNNTRTITIYPDDVLDLEQFKCVVKDKDQTSGTFDKTAEAVSEIIRDLSDPYSVNIDCSTGNILTQGAESARLYANVYRAGQIITDNNFYTNVTFEWTKADKDGNAVSNWGTSGKKTGRYIDVTRDEITIKATYFVTVHI